MHSNSDHCKAGRHPEDLWRECGSEVQGRKRRILIFFRGSNNLKYHMNRFRNPKLFPSWLNSIRNFLTLRVMLRCFTKWSFSSFHRIYFVNGGVPFSYWANSKLHQNILTKNSDTRIVFSFILVTEPYLMHRFGHTQFCIPDPKAFLYPNIFSGLKYSHWNTT